MFTKKLKVYLEKNDKTGDSVSEISGSSVPSIPSDIIQIDNKNNIVINSAKYLLFIAKYY